MVAYETVAYATIFLRGTPMPNFMSAIPAFTTGNYLNALIAETTMILIIIGAIMTENLYAPIVK